MVDGDKSLVVAEPNFVRIAERNMNGVVPLYYNMRKADPTLLNNKTIYAGLNAAFTHGNIGIYSNDISKIWNDDVFVSGSEKEQMEAIDVVKLLCMENNFCIDAAKTLYMPERPDWFKPVVSKYTKKKLPMFFKYAKDKENEQVEKRNESFVNKIFDRIPNKAINTRNLKLEEIDYRLLMNNINIVCSQEVSNVYNKVSKEYSFKVNMKDEYIDNLKYLACTIRKQFNDLGYSDEIVTDMLIQRIYGNNSRRKQLLWFCYGQNIVNNLEKNIQIKKTKFIQCIDCGEWVEVDILNTKTCRCGNCETIHNREVRRLQTKRYRENKACSR